MVSLAARDTQPIPTVAETPSARDTETRSTGLDTSDTRGLEDVTLESRRRFAELDAEEMPELPARYQVIERLGSGGMAEVFRATDDILPAVTTARAKLEVIELIDSTP